MDLLLDPGTHDLVFDNGNKSVTPDITAALAQKLKVKLQTFKGEWFLDENYGAPYRQSIYGKNKNKLTIDIIFQRLIAEEELVKEITYFSSTLLANREYNLTFRVKDKTGNETANISV